MSTGGREITVRVVTEGRSAPEGREAPRVRGRPPSSGPRAVPPGDRHRPRVDSVEAGAESLLAAAGLPGLGVTAVGARPGRRRRVAEPMGFRERVAGFFGLGLGRGIGAGERTTGGALRGASRTFGVGASAGRALAGAAGGFFGGPIGLLTGLVGLDVLLRDGVNPALRSLQEIVLRVNRGLEDTARFSGEVARAVAERDIAQTLLGIERAQRLGPLIAENIRARTDFGVELERLQDRLSESFLPLLTDLIERVTPVVTIARQMTQLVQLLDSLIGPNAVLGRLGEALGFTREGVAEALQQALGITPELADALADVIDPRNAGSLPALLSAITGLLEEAISEDETEAVKRMLEMERGFERDFLSPEGFRRSMRGARFNDATGLRTR